MIRHLLLLAFLPVTTQAIAADPRGDNPDAPASTPQEQLARFHVPPGFEVQLVAAEPEIQKPINLTFDAAGRLWVTGSEMYPWPASVDAMGQPIPDFDKTYADIATTFRTGDEAPPASNIARDSVRILSDFGPDGRARKVEVFADGLNIPSGVQPLPREPGAKGDAALVYSIPNIWRLEDTDGDGRADHREVLYGPFGFVDTHGGSSSYLHWIDGWIYGTHGFKNRSEVRDRAGRVTVLDSGNTYRFRPDGSALEIYTHGQTNPFGLTIDPSGNFYSADSHSKPVYLLVRGGYYEGIGKEHDGLGFAPRITDDDHGSSSIAGIAYYADDKFPEEYRGNLFNGNPVTRKINRDKLEWRGSTPKAIRQPDFLSCDDPWFRPVQVKLGPDGALYIADFYNPIIGHYEVPLTNPRRDHTHGRIWRVVWRGEKKNAPIVAMPDLEKSDAQDLVERLNDRSLLIRILATHELIHRIGPDFPTTSHLDEDFISPTQAAHLLWCRERTGGVNGADLARLLARLTGPTSVAAVKIQTERAVAGDSTLEALAKDFARGEPMRTRAVCDLFARHPRADQIKPLLDLWRDPKRSDSEMVYAARLALHNHLAAPGGFLTAAKLSTDDPEDARRLADVSLAIKTPEAADFLLAQLEQGRLDAKRAGEFVKHTLLYLPEEKLGATVKLIDQAETASLLQELVLATNVAEAARQRDMTLPQQLTAWSQRVILQALASRNDVLAKPAIAAVRDEKLDTKVEPLARIARDELRDRALRVAALEATANRPASRNLLVAILNSPQSLILRKRAAELLAQNGHTDVVLAALPNSPDELALSICSALAKSDAGAAALLDAIDAAKTSPRFLTNKAVNGPLLSRPKPLQERASAMIKDLPPEDTRLNALIAERAVAYGKAKPDTTHGARIFQQNCAACHRFRDAGGNVGPNLDGVIARGPARLIEDILDPNRNVDPLFRQTTIETTDGDILLGANLRDQGDAILFADPAGQSVTIAKDRIKKQTASGLSLMPPIFETAIPAADFNDLLGYLLKPQTGESADRR